MPRARRSHVLVAGLLVAGCGTEDTGIPIAEGTKKPSVVTAGGMDMSEATGPEKKAVRLEGLGPCHRAVSTTNEEAQRWFDQGLVLYYGFNHDEAIRSFREVTRLDDACPMGWWGVALSYGPHINNPKVPPERAKAGYDAIMLARTKLSAGTGIEREIIEATAKRYAKDPNADRGPLDQAYADAMREVWKRHPEDHDVGALFAEALLDLRPWDQWTKDGRPQPGTEELIGVLDRVIASDPNHVGANHFLVHAWEASPTPEKAIGAADRLRTLVPGAGHLLHMPVHIYMRVGRYEDATEANRRAIASDRDYLAKASPPDYYLMYVAHNFQFLCASAMMEGRSAEAIQAARDVVKLLPADTKHGNGEMVDYALALPWTAMARFGRWEELLREPAPDSSLPMTNVISRFARGYAFAATGKAADAERERAALVAAARQVPADAKYGLNPAKDVFAIADAFLRGEIAARQGRLDEAIAQIERALPTEDALHYNEPPDWLLPVRHSLGAVLLEAKRPKDAERVYLEDLKEHPENGWALFGLARALEAQGKSKEAAEAKARFEKAWARADVRLTASRF
jgi:tetratricopeptide (TPR) repeat protein